MQHNYYQSLRKSPNLVKVKDNRGLSQASNQAQEEGVPLLVLFVISPQDFIAHDTGTRKIDFMLRNLHILKVFIVLRSFNCTIVNHKYMRRNHFVVSTYHYTLSFSAAGRASHLSFQIFAKSMTLVTSMPTWSMRWTS